jgi:poly-gamma-glutamate capsule biosynthesis protein CapA/YwtB (metallophosphatase superfamily)
MRYSRRFWMLVCFIAILLLLILPGGPVVAAANQVVLVVGGDVEWALNSRPPTVRYRVVDPKPYGMLVFGKRDVRDQVTGDWPPIPYVYEGESKTYLDSLGLKGGSDDSSGEELSYPLPNQTRLEYTRDYSSDKELLSYPLKRLAPTFHAADLVFVNCEGVLSDHGRQVGLNRTPEKFAKTMKASGISIVNLANNHTFDAEERGFFDTIRNLDSVGIAHTGGGHDLAEARKPVIVERNGIKLGFLGYTQFNNLGESAFAAEGRPGIAPMDPFLMKEDIRRLRPQVDYVLVAIHWSTNRSPAAQFVGVSDPGGVNNYDISPENRKFAHDLIDAGADIILGHHPPHPKGIEVYHGKVILYAPSNVLRGHTNMNADDGYLARFTIGKKSVEKVEVLPIAGKGQPAGRAGQPYDAKLFQPFLMEGSGAQHVLEGVRSRSAALDTAMKIDGDKGVITIPPPSK